MQQNNAFKISKTALICLELRFDYAAILNYARGVFGVLFTQNFHESYRKNSFRLSKGINSSSC